jgi:NDP-sugar pyrophosphorylase family protein
MNEVSLRAEALFDLRQSLAGPYFRSLEYPWQILGRLASVIKELSARLPVEFRKIGDDIWVGKDTEIESSATIKGPAILGSGCEIRSNAYFRGNVLVGDSVTIGNSTEVKNAVLFNGVQVPHFNYVGDSVLGYLAHLGAGVVLANVRLDHGNVVVRDTQRTEIDTGLAKFGALIGDRVEVGCNSVVNPGTIIGKESLIYPLTLVGGIIPPKSIIASEGLRSG